jgi:hypothetical protein
MLGLAVIGSTLLASALAQGGAGAPATASSRRVPISLSFSGSQVFVSASMAAGADSALTVMEGPSAGSVRLMKKGRRALFWLGVRQYELAHAPRLYLVNLHSPTCNGFKECTDKTDVVALTEHLHKAGLRVGREDILARVSLTVLGDEHAEPGEVQEVVDGYWDLQERRGLYGVRDNAIRISAAGVLYQVFHLPTAAPEGKYRVVTYFLRNRNVIAVTESDLFVRQAGLANWLNRMAERRATTYGVMTVAIALATGILAGLIFRRSAKH